jgi:hypothetical protein
MKLPQKNFIDLFNLMLHRAVAEKLQQDAKDVLQIAQNNLNRWLEKSKNSALKEWKKILETRTTEEIIKIITQDTDEGQRLRSSSPFAGTLTDEEREKIWSECAEIRPV